MNLVREPDAGNPPVRFDEREVETEHGMRLLRHRRGNPDPEYAEAYPTAPPLDSTRNTPVPGIPRTGGLGSTPSAAPVAASAVQQAQATDAVLAALAQPQGGSTAGTTAGGESSAWWLLYGQE